MKDIFMEKFFALINPAEDLSPVHVRLLARLEPS